MRCTGRAGSSEALRRRLVRVARHRRTASSSLRRPSSAVMRSVVVHAHFYQPPREHPFFDEIEAEVSAAPYHDWNERIDRECYRAVVAARVTGGHGHIARIVNTLEHLSFNVGPTLCTWLEAHSPDVYRAILDADRISCQRLGGHGNAIAHPYHHVILPLASRRDKVTEVRWGIADFTRRFGREPEGFWLPETAVDDETLDVLAQEGIRFTILAPYQVQQRPPNGLPGRYTTENGRTIALCTYHGDLSHGIAFGGLVRDAGAWAREILAVPADDPAAATLASSRRARGRRSPARLDGDRRRDVRPPPQVRRDGAGARLRTAAAARGAWWRTTPHSSRAIPRRTTWNWSPRPRGAARTAWSAGARIAAAGAMGRAIRARRGAPRCATDWPRSPRSCTRSSSATAGRCSATSGARATRTVRWWDRVRTPATRSPSPRSRRWRRQQRSSGWPSCSRWSATRCACSPHAPGSSTTSAASSRSRCCATRRGPSPLSGDEERLAPMLRRTLQLAESNDAETGTGADVLDRLRSGPDASARTAAAAGALAALGIAPNGELAAAAVAADVHGDEVVVTSRDTGTSRRFRVTVAEQSVHDISCDVQCDEGGAARRALADRPRRLPRAAAPSGAARPPARAASTSTHQRRTRAVGDRRVVAAPGRGGGASARGGTRGRRRLTGTPSPTWRDCSTSSNSWRRTSRSTCRRPSGRYGNRPLRHVVLRSRGSAPGSASDRSDQAHHAHQTHRAQDVRGERCPRESCDERAAGPFGGNDGYIQTTFRPSTDGSERDASPAAGRRLALLAVPRPRHLHAPPARNRTRGRFHRVGPRPPLSAFCQCAGRRARPHARGAGGLLRKRRPRSSPTSAVQRARTPQLDWWRRSPRCAAT